MENLELSKLLAANERLRHRLRHKYFKLCTPHTSVVKLSVKEGTVSFAFNYLRKRFGTQRFYLIKCDRISDNNFLQTIRVG